MAQENPGERNTALRQSGIRIAQGALLFALLLTSGDFIRSAIAFVPAMANGWSDFATAFALIFAQEALLGFTGALILFAVAVAASFGLAREFAGTGNAGEHANACTRDAVWALGAWGAMAGIAGVADGWWADATGAHIITALASLAVLAAATHRLIGRLRNAHKFPAKNAAFAALPFVLIVGWLLWNALTAAIYAAEMG